MSDHFPIMIKLDINKKAKIPSKLKIIFCRDIDRIVTSELKDALEEQDWFSLYDMTDPNEAVSVIVKNVVAALDKVAPPSNPSLFSQTNPSLVSDRTLWMPCL